MVSFLAFRILNNFTIPSFELFGVFFDRLKDLLHDGRSLDSQPSCHGRDMTERLAPPFLALLLSAYRCCCCASTERTNERTNACDGIAYHALRLPTTYRLSPSVPFFIPASARGASPDAAGRRADRRAALRGTGAAGPGGHWFRGRGRELRRRRRRAGLRDRVQLLQHAVQFSSVQFSPGRSRGASTPFEERRWFDNETSPQAAAPCSWRSCVYVPVHDRLHDCGPRRAQGASPTRTRRATAPRRGRTTAWRGEVRAAPPCRAVPNARDDL
jgi:hypothetical protein